MDRISPDGHKIYGNSEIDEISHPTPLMDSLEPEILDRIKTAIIVAYWGGYQHCAERNCPEKFNQIYSEDHAHVQERAESLAAGLLGPCEYIKFKQ